MTAALLLHLALGAVAFLYAAVGHAGASGYTAVLTLAGYEADVVRPTALVLNVLVATLGTYQFYRGGHFALRRFLPYALLSVPGAFVGGRIHVPTEVFRVLIGVVLLLSSARFLVRPKETTTPRPPHLAIQIVVGGVLGLLAGLTATGGGIFLTPVILLLGWARTKETAAISAPYILVNSIAGLLGFVSSGRPLPSMTWSVAPVVMILGALGAYLGSRRFPAKTVQVILGVVLLIAGVKLMGVL